MESTGLVRISWHPSPQLHSSSISRIQRNSSQARRDTWFYQRVAYNSKRVASLLLVDDGVILASSSHDLQCAQKLFVTKCEGMEASPFKLRAMILNWKRVDCSLRIRDGSLRQTKEYMHLSSVFCQRTWTWTCSGSPRYQTTHWQATALLPDPQALQGTCFSPESKGMEENLDQWDHIWDFWFWKDVEKVT